VYGVHPNTVWKWVAAYRVAGEASFSQQRRGRPRGASCAFAVAGGAGREDDPGEQPVAACALDARGGQGLDLAPVQRSALVRGMSATGLGQLPAELLHTALPKLGVVVILATVVVVLLRSTDP